MQATATLLVKLDLSLDMSLRTRGECISATFTSALAQFDSPCDCDNRHLPHWQTDLERPTPLPQCLAARSSRARWSWKNASICIWRTVRCLEQSDSSCCRWRRCISSDPNKKSCHQTPAFKTIMTSRTCYHSSFHCSKLRFPTDSSRMKRMMLRSRIPFFTLRVLLPIQRHLNGAHNALLRLMRRRVIMAIHII
jgi:hypothetical protein